jgi:hypothetical protein
MIWTVWALLLVAHGAFSGWVRAASRHALLPTLGDALLIAIGLMTVSQLQGLEPREFLWVGAFFVAFGMAGRQLMNNILRELSSRGLR